MPSHAAHLLFAFDIMPLPTDTAAQPNLTALNLGAQLPDVFYHNRRTHPSGLYMSVAMHRRGFALLTSHFLSAARTQEQAETAFAFLSHGILDRFLHPWINAFTGWYDPAKAGSMAYRFQHPLCERMIDLWLCTRYQSEWLLGPTFSQHWELPDASYKAYLASVFSEIYPRCKTDPLLNERIDNAFQDCTGYYGWTSTIDEKSYHEGVSNVMNAWEQRRTNGEDESLEFALRFGSLVHPRIYSQKEKALRFLDTFFEDNKTTWVDPCHDRTEVHKSFHDVWKEAKVELARLIGVLGIDLHAGPTAQTWINTANRPSQRDIYSLLVSNGFHDADLRSRIQGDSGCDLDFCQPIDWFQIWFDLEATQRAT